MSTHGRAANACHEYGYWGLSEETADVRALSGVLRDLLNRTPSNLLDLLNEQRVTADLFVGIFGVHDQSSVELEPDVLREAGARGWPIYLDLYVLEQE